MLNEPCVGLVQNLCGIIGNYWEESLALDIYSFLDIAFYPYGSSTKDIERQWRISYSNQCWAIFYHYILVKSQPFVDQCLITIVVYRISKATSDNDACRENEGSLGGKQCCGGHCCRTGRGTIAAVMAIPIRALHKVRTDLHRNFADSGSRNSQKSFGRLHSARSLSQFLLPPILHYFYKFQVASAKSSS